MSQFRTKDGRMTAYALACGYSDTRPHKRLGGFVALWREHDTYHVRGFYSHLVDSRCMFWESFPVGELAAARHCFLTKYEEPEVSK